MQVADHAHFYEHSLYERNQWGSISSRLTSTFAILIDETALHQDTDQVL